METSLPESQTDSYFPTKWPNGYPKQKDVNDTHIQRRTITKINHDRRTASERSVKSISLGAGVGGGDLNRFYVADISQIVTEASISLPSLTFYASKYDGESGNDCDFAVKSLPEHHHTAGYILFPLGLLSHLSYFENRIPLKPALWGVCSLANYSAKSVAITRTKCLF